MADREMSKCVRCRSSRRAQCLARAIIESLDGGERTSSLAELVRVPAVQRLRVAEVNPAGGLHRYLAQIPGLLFSQYGSSDSAVPHEDLQRLSYADDSLDVLVSSETLEHVPDVEVALAEIRRVLVPGGLHLFTVPIVLDGRPTRLRASLGADGSTRHHLPPSFHGSGDQPDYLVFHEFGHDFVGVVERAGFEVTMLYEGDNPALVAFATRVPRR